MTATAHAESRRSLADRRRRLVVIVAIATALFKLFIAANTLGTNDVFTFQQFANAIRHFGPIGIYGHHLVEGTHVYPVYNHPPLVGWMLVAINRVSDAGPSFPFLIRVPATLADVVTVWLVFELVRMRRSLNEATLAAVLVAFSPALIIVSGFHGNTDPVFIMFSFLSLYLLLTDRSAFVAGLAFGAALSIKIVPIVALPVLLLVAARSGKRRLVMYIAGSAALLVVLWGPVILHRWTPFSQEVLGFKGYTGQWGIVEFAALLGFSKHSIRMLQDSGRSILLVLSAGLPFLLAWKRKDSTIPAFGLSFVLVLLLSTATGGRYLVWAVPAAFLINFWAATLYDLASGVLLLVVYSRWNDAFPWAWNKGSATDWTHTEVFIAAIAWFALLGVAVMAMLSREVAFRRISR